MFHSANSGTMSARLRGSGERFGILNSAMASTAPTSTAVQMPALHGPRTRVAVLSAVGSSVKCGATASHTFITWRQCRCGMTHLDQPDGPEHEAALLVGREP
jgi:hypothetical protein